jgi:hypothetical protein
VLSILAEKAFECLSLSFFAVKMNDFYISKHTHLPQNVKGCVQVEEMACLADACPQRNANSIRRR